MEIYPAYFDELVEWVDYIHNTSDEDAESDYNEPEDCE